MQMARSLLANASIYVAMLVIGILWLPWAIVSREGARSACLAWCAYVKWAMRVFCGLRNEVRGTPPAGEVMIAAKHQSFLDIVLIFSSVPKGKFIMKRELIWAPILGVYALRIGCVPVDRGKRGKAIEKMKADVEKGRSEAGQLIIYPQGTRVAPDEKKPYKVGTAALYQQLGQPCVPVAANVGHFWPKRGVLRRPGVAVVEFLPPIPPGLEVRAFMERLERDVETASDRLLGEARGR